MRTLKIETREEIERIIRSCKTCYMALCEDNNPYIVPMNFALEGDTVILHSAQSGRKWDIIKKNPRICINWTQGEEIAWQDIGVGCSYRVKARSVIVEGIAEIVEGYEEKVFCLEKLMAQYSLLKFTFGTPSVRNVGIIKVHIGNLTALKFGAKAGKPRNRAEEESEDI